MSKNYIKEAMRLNNATFNDYYCRLKLLATSLFEWHGLDKIGGNSYFLENALFSNGIACFVQDKKYGYLTLNCSDNGKKNVYNEPTEIIASGVNYNERYNADDVVIIKNNNLLRSTDATINLICRRLYECQRTIDVNMNNLKFPIILEGTTKTKLTLENLLEQYSGNVPFIFGRKESNIMDNLKVLELKVDYNIDKLEDEKKVIWNECLTYLGINNSNIDKKERVLTDEVNSNNELIKYYLNCFLEPRKKACEEINKKFFNGEEKISVSINEEVENLIKLTFDDIINNEDNKSEGELNNE